MYFIIFIVVSIKSFVDLLLYFSLNSTLSIEGISHEKFINEAWNIVKVAFIYFFDDNFFKQGIKGKLRKVNKFNKKVI